MESKTEGSGWVVGLIAGGLIGFIVAAGLGGAGVYVLGKREFRRARAGWNLVPTIVYSQDLAAGAVVTYDVLSQRPVPEQFVTSSGVKPDDATHFIGARLALPVQAGDLTTWRDFADGQTPERCEKVCQWAGQAEPARAKRLRDALGRLEQPTQAAPGQRAQDE